MANIKEQYKLYSDTFKYYLALIDDISNAKEYVYLETYRFNNDTIGIRFRDVLTKIAQKGVEVKLLLDSWGSSSVSYHFFADLIKFGGEVRFFEKIKINFDFFTRSHRRNHRKIAIIDDEISYIGSSNVTDYNLNWKESVLRLKGEISLELKKIFSQDFRIYNKYILEKQQYVRLVKFAGFEIIRDIPSITIKRINKKFIKLIKDAKASVCIQTPYFLPGFLLRKALSDAAKRGVKVKVLIPQHSDVGLVDILRNKYIGPLHKSGVRFMYHLHHNLHAKTMLVDEKIFSVGSSNFDYRSFRYMYEIILSGEEESICKQLKEHTEQTISDSEAFDFEKWLRRPVINKVFEWLLLPVRHLL